MVLKSLKLVLQPRKFLTLDCDILILKHCGGNES